MVSITISKIVDTGSNPVPLEKGGVKIKFTISAVYWLLWWNW
jgi:hypothetical protein